MSQSDESAAKATVLVADGYRASRAGLRMNLVVEGYDVVAVASGAQALVAVRDGASDTAVALLDEELPDMTGEQLALELRSICPDIGVVLMSGYAPERAVLRNDERRLSKPLHMDTVVETVNEILIERESSSDGT